MIRNINIFLLFVSVAMLAGVYALKFSIEGTASERTALIAQISDQEGQLSLLKADWAVLNQPGHIDPIVQRHQALIADEVAADTRKLYSTEAFTSAVNGSGDSLKAFLDLRRAYLLRTIPEPY